MSDDYTSTGIAGADKILGEKGIPKGHSILVAGGPGSGKTTFAMQFLYKGVTQYNDPGIYISLDEDPEDVKKNMSKFGWDLGKLEQEKKLAFINVSPVRVTSSEKAASRGLKYSVRSKIKEDSRYVIARPSKPTCCTPPLM